MQSLPAFAPRADETALRVRTYTFGCKVNLSDTVAIENALGAAQGVEVNGSSGPADVVIVNTCSVTSEADRQARQLLRRIHRELPNARVIVTGCYAQSDPERIRKIEGVTDVVPMEKQGSIANLLGLPEEIEGARTVSFGGRTRAFVKLQDGCNSYCSFCILPYLRGKSRSLSPEDLERQVKEFEGAGFREVVVTGTHLGAYGRDLRPRLTLARMLARLGEAAPTIQFRISSLEPATLSLDLIRLTEEWSAIRPHFHIPLQSGSDAILRRMNRRYRMSHYRRRVEALAATRSDLAIGADVIVGFPGESEADFSLTLRAVEMLPITYLHVFPYSSRPGTSAASFEDDVPFDVKRERVKALFELGQKKKMDFYSRFVGRIQPVLVEKKRDRDGRLTGYTPHYVPVHVPGPDRLMEREVDVRMIGIEGDIVVGEIL